MSALRACSSRPACVSRSSRRSAVIANSQVNPNIRKTEDKVVDIVKAAELPKPKAVVCRCWRSSKFPYCDGAHVKHNKETGDNVGPFVIDNAP